MSEVEVYSVNKLTFWAMDKNVVGKKIRVRLFADDCIMYRQINNTQDSVDLQKDIDRLCGWEQCWQMQFNKAKCHAMHITHKKKDDWIGLSHGGLGMTNGIESYLLGKG